MKTRSPLKRIPENAVFWLLLLSLSIGCAASLTGKLREKAREETNSSSLLPAAAASEIRSLKAASPLSREQVLRILRADPDFHVLLPSESALLP
ncbi:MAG: hypothetical protein HFE84_06735 [Lachnospiraceae bacterium]|nr:hypothetical protein [Lachnospiraceae bacterium]